MPGPLHWTCRCGKVEAHVAEGAGARLTCYCKHCRAYARLLKADGLIDDAGGSALYQTTPDLISFGKGMDQLRCLRMTSKGPLRWYAGCCDTPLANTASTPAMPFVGLLMGGVQDADAAGPETARVYTDGATAPLTGKSGGMVGAVAGIMLRAVRGRLRGAHRNSPFFSADGKPVRVPREVSPEERAAAYDA